MGGARLPSRHGRDQVPEAVDRPDERPRGGLTAPPPPRAAIAAGTFEGYLRRCNFPSPATAVTCAVSGGPDSLALLVLASAANLQVTAVYVDHGLRSASGADAAVVAAAAAALGAEFRCLQATVAPGPNLEARARRARYGVLPPDALLGHTADDRAETVLLNLLRGAGPAGVAAMPPEHRRPLLGLRHADTREVCRLAGLTPALDESNLDPAIRRNRVRHELVPLLEEIFERDVTPLLCRHADLAHETVEALDAAVAELDPRDGAALAAAPRALARWALRRWIAEARGATTTGDRHPPDLAAVDRALAVATGDAKAADVGGGWRVRRSARRLHLELAATPPAVCQTDPP
ncbi:MAG: tRNA lysidine(34) synthetase TilS [Acidimicrobiia bacterium]|nr:tRNA lysidine(34) synthetase TilS [Acidimicrobiia bacterium]